MAIYLIYFDNSKDLSLVKFLRWRWHRDAGQSVR